YVGERSLRLLAPEIKSALRFPADRKLVGKDLKSESEVQALFKFLANAQRRNVPVTVYPDAEELLNTFLHSQRINRLVKDIRRDPAAHPLRKSLLNIELLPYQLDGIAFAAGAG